MSIWSSGRPRNMTKVDFALRFEHWIEPEPNTGCWLWIGANTGRAKRPNHVYGLSWDGERRGLAHRFVYQYYNGPVDPRLHFDHKCLQTLCVNPRHCEPVTRKENERRRHVRTIQIPWRV